MSPRASYPAAFLWIASLVFSAGVEACAGTSVSEFTVATAPDDAGTAVVHGMDAATDASTAAAPDGLDGSAEAMAAAAVYQGNPLCNASPATSCCYPDALSVCGPATCESPSDAGPAEGGGGYSQPVEYGCHLVPSPPPSSPVMGSPPRPDAQVLQCKR